MSSNNTHEPILIGMVYRKTLGHYTVQTENGFMECVLSSLLRKDLEGWFGISESTNIRRQVKKVHKIKAVDPVAVGDEVEVLPAPDGSGVIKGVLPRRNQLSRMAPDGKNLEQVMAANIDQVLAVFSACNPAPKWNLLDRYLCAAENAGIPALILITKLDLIDEDDPLFEEVSVYEGIGYPVLPTSTVDGRGIAALKDLLRGKTSLVIGKSGVGKSSLLNAVQPELGIRVQEVSAATTKGRHTTTHLEMFPLEMGGTIIDTPGMREYGLWEADARLDHLFREMEAISENCRFGTSCLHDREPDCAVRDAVETGQISQRRYQSYLKMR